MLGDVFWIMMGLFLPYSRPEFHFDITVNSEWQFILLGKGFDGICTIWINYAIILILKLTYE